MALDDPYVDLAFMKQMAGIKDDRDDAVLTQAIDAASRQIEKWTGRNFNQSAPGTVRCMDSSGNRSLMTVDIVSLDEVAMGSDGLSWTQVVPLTAYYLWPEDAPDRGEPYRQIRSITWPFLPCWRRGVRLTGVFGWPSVPTLITQATALQANRYWKRNTAPFGIAGGGGPGHARAESGGHLDAMMLLPGLDPDVKQMISGFKRVVV